MRLQKYIADCGIASRRGAEKIIEINIEPKKTTKGLLGGAFMDWI